MGQYVVLENKDRYCFNLCDSDGHILAKSIVFPSRDECLDAITAMQSAAKSAPIEDASVDGYVRQGAPKYRVYEDMDGSYYFRYFAANAEDVAQSYVFDNKESLMTRLERMKKESTSSLANEL